MVYKNVVWEGRFQPVHLGHVDYIKTLLQRAERLWIVVVENEVSARIPGFKSPVPEFSRIVDEHHAAEKNPFPLWFRHLLVVETIKAEIGPDAPVYVWAGRRMDICWDFYSSALPHDRVFLTPERDEFEDAKAAAWAKLGERVERIDVSHIRKISATQTREAIQRGLSLTGLLSPRTGTLVREFMAGSSRAPGAARNTGSSRETRL